MIEITVNGKPYAKITGVETITEYQQIDFESQELANRFINELEERLS